MSSDSDEDNNQGAKKKASKETVKLGSSSKLSKSKAISKSKTTSTTGASRKEMHGATIVPIAAHLKYKKLLEKK